MTAPRFLKDAMMRYLVFILTLGTAVIALSDGRVEALLQPDGNSQDGHSKSMSINDRETRNDTFTIATERRTTSIAVKSPASLQQNQSSRISGRSPKHTDSALASARPVPKGSFYSHLRNDRSGSAIVDMLRAHAFAYLKKVAYLGACPRNGKDVPSNLPSKIRSHKKLLSGVGLQNVLPIACPPANNQSFAQILEPEEYIKESATTMRSKNWLNHLYSDVRYPPTPKNDGAVHVAVHVRRGDVRPCVTAGVHKQHYRYLPNSHYLSILDEYLPKDRPAKVTIFSEEASFESFDDFIQRNYTLKLNSDVSQVWRAMMVADVLVMSKSCFSFVPALLNRHGTILFTKHWNSPLSNWTIVNSRIMHDGDVALKSLQAKAGCSRRPG